MNYHLDGLEKGLKSFGLSLSEEQKSQFITYYEMLIEKNKVMNLTAITDFDEVVMKHFLDSIAICQVVSFQNRTNVLDLGTGAGFPGIPLKIVFPQLEITLMDSLNKRVLFLRDVIDELGLTGIEAVHGRAEEAGRNQTYRESYDLCVSRAVANIATLSEYCLPFVRVGGRFVSYKSSTVDEEVEEGKKSIELMGGHISQVYKFALPDTDLQRSFVVISKEKKTPKKYPRKAGTPSKDPIH